MSAAPATEERFIDNGDIRLRVEVTGDGPTILCVHGWPELPISWRHQVRHLAQRGWRVAALDVRGYGGSSVPAGVERYTLRELAGDVAAVAAALDDGPVILVGHDWGSPIVSQAAVRHPGRVRAVANLSVPYLPPRTTDLIAALDRAWADRFYYMLRFQEPGVIEAEFDADLRGALKRVYHAGSGAAPGGLLPAGPRDAAFLPLLPEPPAGPLPFLPDAELDVYAATFRRTGMVGAFNRYRAVRLDPAENAEVEGAILAQPSCFIAGEHDLVRNMLPGLDLFASPGAACADFRGATIVPGAGHWIQQEAPDAVNAALDTFLAGL
ncbi:MAG: alpha/beta fold hydrolase [Chloroflexota bacterium]